MDTPESKPPSRDVIGGRHGSPTITIAWPFSVVQNVDSELRDMLGELALLVARLAATDDREERAALQSQAEEIAERLRRP